jgi:hypothetical protein
MPIEVVLTKKIPLEKKVLVTKIYTKKKRNSYI